MDKSQITSNINFDYYWARINPKRTWPESIPTTPVPPTSMKERTATLWFMVFSEADDKFYGLFAPMVFHYIKKRETAAPPLPSCHS